MRKLVTTAWLAVVVLLALAASGHAAGTLTPVGAIDQPIQIRDHQVDVVIHDATLKVSGVKVFDGTDEAIGKIYRGQQLVLFGRYDRGGKAAITLKATLTGQDKTYTTAVHFPDVDTRNPEVERLWALNRVEALEMLQLRGRLPAREAEQAVRQLGVTYQLVTDQTSMIVLADESFEKHRIERRNRERVALERQTQAVRAGQAPQSYRVDQSGPMFGNPPAPSLGGSRGGGAHDPATAGLAVALAALALWAVNRLRQSRQRRS
jgi:Ca-activated chloride channel family protein